MKTWKMMSLCQIANDVLIAKIRCFVSQCQFNLLVQRCLQ